MPMYKVSLPLAIGVVHPNIGGWLGAYCVKKNLDPWYKVRKEFFLLILPIDPYSIT